MSDVRRVWLAAGAIAVVVLALLGYELLKSRDYYTGTNSAGSSGPAAHVGAGQELCVRAVHVPAGTGRVLLRLAPHPDTTVRTRDVQGGRAVALGPALVASVGGPPGSTPGRLELPLGAGAAAQVCVTPSGPIDVAGRPEPNPLIAAPTINGAPLQGRVALWFLPRGAAQKSLLSQLPAIARRAALFRPGVVGPWTYWLLLLLVPAGVAFFALRLVAGAVSGEAVPGRVGVQVAVLGFVAAASWSLLTPVLNAPDELEHVAYVQAVAEQGRAPHAGPDARRAYSTEAQAAYEGAQLPGQYRQRDGRPPWDAFAESSWRHRERVLHARGDDGGGWTTVADYTPAYYAAVAPAWLVASRSSFFTKVTAARLATALLSALAGFFTVLLMRELLPRPGWPAVVAGLFVALQPMFSFMAGMVNNDGPVAAAAAAALWLVMRALRRGPDVRGAVALGALCVAMPMLKGNGLFILAPVGVGVVGVLLRARPGVPWGVLARGGGALVAALLAFVVLASALHHSTDPTRPGWYASTGNAYPTLPGKAVVPSQALHEPARFASYLWQMVLPPLPGTADLAPGGVRSPAFTAYMKRGWGAFAFAVVLFPTWVYVAIAFAMLGVTGLGLRLGVRVRGRLRAYGWELAVLATAIVAVVLGTELAYYAPGGSAVPEFGRYLFPAASAFAVLSAGALFGAGRRGAVALGAGLVTAIVGLWWAGLWLTASQLYT